MRIETKKQILASRRWRLNEKLCALVNDGKTSDVLKVRAEIEQLDKALSMLKKAT